MRNTDERSENLLHQTSSRNIWKNGISLIAKLGLILAAVSTGVFGFNQIEAAEKQDYQPVLLLSIDGLKPEYVLNADQHGLKIPNFRKMTEEGSYATAVKGVLPASTFPGHITLITGVHPARHGIYHNRPFDPEKRVSGERWDWLAEHIRVPTLWNLASAAGRTTAGVGWPVSVGAEDIHFNIPERVIGSDSEKVWSVVTPGLADKVGEAARKRIREGDVKIAKADWQRASYALEIIAAEKPDLIAVHLAAGDTMQHRHGPFSKEAIAAYEEIDEMIGILTEAFRNVHPDGIVSAASDHGFSEIDQVFRVDAALERAEFIEFDPRGKNFGESEVSSWIAKQLPAGGSAPVFLKNREDAEARDRLKKVLNNLAADPQNGIASILERDEIAQLGGNPDADFWIDLVPGTSVSQHLDGPLAAPQKRKGTHGYSPAHPEMNSAFFISGKNIQKGLNLGEIDMRTIAPTLAKALGIKFSTADAPPLDLFESEN